MRLGKTPTELLEATNSAELMELFAHFTLQEEMHKKGAEPSGDVESQLKQFFGEA